jgi:hypothetical protein
LTGDLQIRDYKRMTPIKPVSESASKWVSRAGQAAGDYKAGVQNPRRSWEDATAAAKEAQAAGVQEAIANGTFERGVREAGNAKWQRKASEVGSARFGPGVAAAKPDYEAGFTPYAQKIAGITLPPRGPKGDPRNYDRVKTIGDELHNLKVTGS